MNDEQLIEKVRNLPRRKDGQFDRRYRSDRNITLDEARRYNTLCQPDYMFIPSDALAELRASRMCP